jgi:murein DD-endopeptidase MepM/ murein hydrolase activator NlpD
MAYDLSLYLCTPGKPYRLVGFGDEVCQVQRAANGYSYQVKNSAAETLWFDTQFIYRGLDTSSKDDPNTPEVYAQFTAIPGGLRYGAPWAKRMMDIGEVFKRSPDVAVYTRTGTLKKSDSNIVSYLKLATHYPAYNFVINGQQRLVNDVIQLLWTLDPAGNQVVERYWYARSLGLVSFQFVQTGQLSAIVPGDPARAPVREVLTWFNEPVPPPTVSTQPPPVYPPGTQPVLSLVRQGGVRLRANPGTAEATIRNMNLNEQVTVYQAPVVNKDGYNWVRVLTAQGQNGWAAREISGVATFAPVPPAFRLKMPFRNSIISSRFNTPRDYSKIAPTKLQKHEGIDIVDGLAAQHGSDPTIHVGAPGTVVEAGFQATGYGNYIRVSFGNNWFAYYGHMAEVYVRQGQVLRDWQIIGLMGETGFAEGRHVHIAVQHIGQGLPNYVVADVVDPEPLLIQP